MLKTTNVQHVATPLQAFSQHAQQFLGTYSSVRFKKTQAQSADRARGHTVHLQQVAPSRQAFPSTSHLWTRHPPFVDIVEDGQKGRPSAHIVERQNATKTAGLHNFCELGVIVGVKKGALPQRLPLGV